MIQLANLMYDFVVHIAATIHNICCASLFLTKIMCLPFAICYLECREYIWVAARLSWFILLSSVCTNVFVNVCNIKLLSRDQTLNTSDLEARSRSSSTNRQPGTSFYFKDKIEFRSCDCIVKETISNGGKVDFVAHKNSCTLWDFDKILTQSC